MHAKKKFYGNSNPELRPEVGETADAFRQRGGIPGKFIGNPDAGVIYREIDGVGVFVNVADEDYLSNEKNF
jgi:hypothetical protein